MNPAYAYMLKEAYSRPPLAARELNTLKAQRTIQKPKSDLPKAKVPTNRNMSKKKKMLVLDSLRSPRSVPASQPSQGVPALSSRTQLELENDPNSALAGSLLEATAACQQVESTLPASTLGSLRRKLAETTGIFCDALLALGAPSSSSAQHSNTTSQMVDGQRREELKPTALSNRDNTHSPRVNSASSSKSMVFVNQLLDGVDLPTPEIPPKEVEARSHAMEDDDGPVPLPVTPIARNYVSLLSPTRPRTPGSGILSPPPVESFRSPQYRDMFNYSRFVDDEEDDETMDADTSFIMLPEELPYDSDDYSSCDERFPNWSRKQLPPESLAISCKREYDSHFTARVMKDIQPNQVSKGTCSEDYEEILPDKMHPRAKIGDFSLGRPVGAGKFGTIYLARVRAKPQLYVAIKVMFKRCLSKNHVTQLLREIQHLDQLRSDHVISLYDFFHDAQRIYLVMEYANGGDLYHTLSGCKRLSEAEAANIFQQSVRAIQTCHENDIIHRDIKPENFVWGADGRLKLIDLGWSAPCGVGSRRETLCGTLDYLPPEMVIGKPYGQMADIWCLGVLLFELLTGSPPFEDEDYLVTKLNIKYVTYKAPEYLSLEAKRFIASILKADPLSRPTLQQLLTHPWVVSNSQSA